MTIKVLDKSADGNKQVQKVTKPDGTLLRYQAGTPGIDMQQFNTLQEARQFIGKRANGKALESA